MPHLALQQSTHWIASDTALERSCETWAECPLLAMDTEFVRTDTYYPIAGLFQINDGKANYLIDPKAISDWTPLIELIDDDARIVALHSCSEDIEVLHVEFGAVPANILDTQIAAAFLGFESSLGYANLIERTLGHVVPKEETRSNWLQRPLSQAQMQYAALDVEFLFPLALRFRHDLEDQGRLQWVLEESRALFRNFKHAQDIQQSHQRVKSAWKLSPRKLAVLMALSRWRETAAQQRNVPRNRILKEASLFELALSTPTHLAQLRTIAGLSDSFLRREGPEVVSLIQEQLALDEQDLPEALPGQLSREERQQLQILRDRVQALSEEHRISPEILMKKKDLERLLRLKLRDDTAALQDFFHGWRAELLAEPMMEALACL